MSKMLYCIEHERMFHAEEGIVFGHEIIIRASADESPELEFCEFENGWATCPPPVVEDLEERVQ